MANNDKRTIIHKETFQNANQMVEVLICTKPKPFLNLNQKKSKPKPFVRECALKKTLDRISEESSEVIQPTKAKKSQRVTVDVSKSKKPSRRNTSEHSADATWADILKSCSTIASSDCSGSSGYSDELDNWKLKNNKSKHGKKAVKKLEGTAKFQEISQVKDIHEIDTKLNKVDENKRVNQHLHIDKEIPVSGRLEYQNEPLINQQPQNYIPTGNTHNPGHNSGNVDTPQSNVSLANSYGSYSYISNISIC